MSLPAGWEPSAVKKRSGPKVSPLTPDDKISVASQLASLLQLKWEGVVAESPRVPPPSSAHWTGDYSPEEYVAALAGLALTGWSDKLSREDLEKIRETDAHLIGYILLLEKRVSGAACEKFCCDLLVQQLARVK